MSAKTKTQIINLAMVLFGWVDKIKSRRLDKITLADKTRWWLEGHVNRLFSWAYAGSDEELAAVEQMEIPLKHMSARQREHLLALMQAEPEPVCMECVCCRWTGTMAETEHDECPQCSHNVYPNFYQPEAV